MFQIFHRNGFLLKSANSDWPFLCTLYGGSALWSLGSRVLVLGCEEPSFLAQGPQKG